MKVAVIGASGRMGSTVCAALSEAADIELVAAVDTKGVGEVAAGSRHLLIQADLACIAAAGAEVAVDFTVAAAAVDNAVWSARQGIHAVIGATGIDDAALSRLEAAFPTDGPVGCVVAPNFAVGAVLMMRFAEMAAPYFESAEIIEMHHDSKVDAPSGTAMLTAQRMAAASDEWAQDPTRTQVLPGARGADGPSGIHIHSVRLRGLVAHQEVLLGTTGQSLTIRHDSYDRVSFMPGVLMAVRKVVDRTGVVVGLEQVLGI